MGANFCRIAAGRLVSHSFTSMQQFQSGPISISKTPSPTATPESDMAKRISMVEPSQRNKQIVQEANSFIEHCFGAGRFSAASAGKFLLEHPEDLGWVEGEQWDELHDLLVQTTALTFAIHQCQFILSQRGC